MQRGRFVSLRRRRQIQQNYFVGFRCCLRDRIFCCLCARAYFDEIRPVLTSVWSRYEEAPEASTRTRIPRTEGCYRASAGQPLVLIAASSQVNRVSSWTTCTQQNTGELCSAGRVRDPSLHKLPGKNYTTSLFGCQ